MTLRDQTRRTLALLLFFFFGPMLTFGLVAGIAVRKASWNVKLYEQTIGNLRIGSVEYRTPTCVCFRDVDILDAATETPLFHAPEVEWSFVSSEKLGEFFPGLIAKEKNDRKNQPSLESFVSFFSTAFGIRSDVSGFYRLSIPLSEVRFETLTPGESAKRTQELLFDLLTRYRKNSDYPIQIAVEQVNLRLRNDGNQELPDSVRFVQGNLYRAAESTRSDWTFQIPAVSELETQRFSVEDRPSVKGPEIVLCFSNRLEKDFPKTIPCELAGYFSSFFHVFSKSSRFSGEITAEYRAAEPGWTLRMEDLYLRNLDVAQYAAEYTPFPISGNANVYIRYATFGNKIFTADGWLEVLHGKMDRVLFHRLVDRFALRVEPSDLLNSAAAMVPFDQSVVTFRLNRDGAAFWNDSSPDPNLFMIRNALPPLEEMKVYLSGEKTPNPYPAILAAFAPDEAPLLPLTPGIQKIIPAIVLPSEQPRPTTSPVLPAIAAPR